MKFFLLYILFTSSVLAEITQSDLIKIINKVETFGILPKSVIEHAKEEVKAMKPSDIKQINSASKVEAPKLPLNLPSTPNEKNIIPENIKKDLKIIKENAKKRQKLLDDVMKE